MKALQKLLLVGVQNRTVRSALANLEVGLVVSVGTVVAAEAGNGHIDVRVISGAAAAAVLKWLHSLASTAVESAAPPEHPIVQAAQAIVAEPPAPPVA